jgi:hypothetical protein
MVHNDYNIGNSTRIDQVRTLNTNPFGARIFEARGRYLGWGINLIGFWFPAIYFWKKFNQSKLPLRILGTLFLSRGISSYINGLVILNIGNPAEFEYLTSNYATALDIHEIAQIDYEKVTEENQLHVEESIRKLNKK